MTLRFPNGYVLYIRLWTCAFDKYGHPLFLKQASIVISWGRITNDNTLPHCRQIILSPKIDPLEYWRHFDCGDRPRSAHRWTRNNHEA